MKISVDKSASHPIYIQIYDQIRAMIIGGLLLPGYRLPSERRLANLLAISRQPVLLAYHELKQCGLICSKPGRQGTVVAKQEGRDSLPSTKSAPRWNLLISNRVANFAKKFDDDLFLAINRKDAISFVGAWTNFSGNWTDEFPLPDAMPTAIESHETGIVSPAEGLWSFRESIGRMMFNGGGYCDPGKIVITRGGLQGLDLITSTLINPGDIILCEDPTYHQAKTIFQRAEARLVGVPMTTVGMDLNILKEMLEQYHAKFIYTMPTAHNPSGVTMNIGSRKRLLQLAYEHNTPIVEDDPYWGMRYNKRPGIPTLRSMDKGDHVVYIGTLSKVVSPRLEIGWIIAPRKLVRTLRGILNITTLNSNTSSQLITQQFIESGGIDLHMNHQRDTDVENDQLFNEVMRQRPIPGLYWEYPTEGPCRCIMLPRGMHATKLVKKASVNGVTLLPGTLFSIQPDSGEHFVRVSMRTLSPSKIAAGLGIFLDTVEELL